MKKASELMRYYRYVFDNNEITEADMLKFLRVIEKGSAEIQAIISVLQEAEAKRLERQLLIESIKRGQWFIKHWRILLVVSWR